jgi:hypothetical protein
MCTGSFPGVKRPGRVVDHPPPSSVEVKERIELYIYSPLGLRGLFWGKIYKDIIKRFLLFLYHSFYKSDLIEIFTGPYHNFVEGLLVFFFFAA